MSAAERFISTATDPLAGRNAELHLAAKATLRERIDEGDTAAIDAATERLRGRGAWSWIKWLLIATALVSLPLLVLTGGSYWQFVALREIVDYGPWEVDSPLAGPLNASERLLLHGDPGSRPGEQWKPLWQSRPEHPPFFVEYAAGYAGEHKQVPPDYFDTVEAIDPNNGWFWLLAAGCEAEGSVTRGQISRRDREAGVATRFTIDDPLRHRAALEHLHTAAAKPRIESYSRDLLRERIALFPERSDFLSQVPAFAYLAGLTAHSVPLSLGDAIAAEAQRCGDEADLEGYERLKGDLQRVAPGLIADGSTLIEVLIARVVLARGLRNLRDTAAKLGRPEDEEAFRQLELELNPPETVKQQREARAEEKDRLLRRKGSLLARIAFPALDRQLRTPVPLSEAELAPTRRVDHALLGRLFGLGLWAALGLALALVVLFRFRHGDLVRELSLRMRDLLRPVDWAWILAGGTLGPVAWHLAVAQLGPLAAHHWSAGYSAFMLPSGQFTATGWLMLVTPVVLGRGRLGRRAGFLGLRPRHPWIGWLALGCAALSVPVFGLAPYRDEWFQPLTIAGGALLAAAQLWLLGVGLRALARSREKSLAPQSLARILVAPYALGMTLAILSLPVFHRIERQWTARDELFEISVDQPSFTRFEYRVTEQLRRELLESFASLPR